MKFFYYIMLIILLGAFIYISYDLYKEQYKKVVLQDNELFNTTEGVCKDTKKSEKNVTVTYGEPNSKFNIHKFEITTKNDTYNIRIFNQRIPLSNHEIGAFLGYCSLDLLKIEYYAHMENLFLKNRNDTFNFDLMFLDWTFEKQTNLYLEVSFRERIRFFILNTIIEDFEEYKNRMFSSFSTTNSLQEYLHSVKDDLILKLTYITSEIVGQIWGEKCAKLDKCKNNIGTVLNNQDLQDILRKNVPIISRRNIQWLSTNNDKITVLIMQKHLIDAKNDINLQKCRQFRIGFVI
ncbi:hypothetical protein EDEG_02407 [Edhazardia aedis USNM 41457]|uniref:Uncharacterized protein n=1 Tax=Edhazardia aedis (strain USNM 41457) TaxID=1003232 RepID=J9D6U1_EDHAE|nr:hypothetical protein EDEG_02407 [Edhazardia aedis USNM 41457]|eukprot:EJW03239.1 hypothetical protein EDEG_02407 [Edhazardia aedis USNM 41457]